MRVLSLFILTLLYVTSNAQNDSLVLTERQFLYFLENNHPVSVRANLLEKEAQMKVRKARGGFDPKLVATYDEKQFKSYEYFSILNGGLKVPTWYGVEFKAGLDQNSGQYLNPQNNVPNNGLVYAGVSVSLGKNLLIDQRRATLKQAKIFAEANKAKRLQIMNDLYFDGMKAYWYWVKAWNEYQIYEQGVNLVEKRFEGVKQSFLLGDKPAIDTLEAYIQVQNRQLNRNKALLTYRNAGLELSNYLWSEDLIPLEVTDSLHPNSSEYEAELKEVSKEKYLKLYESVGQNHPESQAYTYKLSQLEVEKRLKRENLKPKLNLNYNALTENVGNNPFAEYSNQNYKWGIDFVFPLFLRKETGDLKLTKLKIQDLKYTQQEKILHLRTKMKRYYNEHLNLQDQVKITSNIVEDYDKLLLGEKLKFDSGESSLFLVNTREKNLIKAKLKLNEMITKYHIAHAGVLWASGALQGIFDVN